MFSSIFLLLKGFWYTSTRDLYKFVPSSLVLAKYRRYEYSGRFRLESRIKISEIENKKAKIFTFSISFPLFSVKKVRKYWFSYKNKYIQTPSKASFDKEISIILPKSLKVFKFPTTLIILILTNKKLHNI